MWTLSCGTKRVFATDLIFWNVVKSHWLFVEEALVMLTSWLAYKIHCTALYKCFLFLLRFSQGKRKISQNPLLLPHVAPPNKKPTPPLALNSHVAWSMSPEGTRTSVWKNMGVTTFCSFVFILEPALLFWNLPFDIVQCVSPFWY